MNLRHFELWDLELLTSFFGSSKYRHIVEIDGADTKKMVFNTVDGSEIRLAPVELNSLSHYLQGFIHPEWFAGISSINSINQFLETGPFQTLLTRNVFPKMSCPQIDTKLIQVC